MSIDLAAAREAYARDGAVLIPKALDAKALGEAQAAYDWSLANPGPGATRFAQALAVHPGRQGLQRDKRLPVLVAAGRHGLAGFGHDVLLVRSQLRGRLVFETRSNE